MARLRFGDQSIPRVTRVATGGGGGNVGALADVDLTDTKFQVVYKTVVF